MAFANRYTNLRFIDKAKLVSVKNNQENFLTVVYLFDSVDINSFLIANRKNNIDCKLVRLTKSLFDKKYANQLEKCNVCFVGINKSWWGKLDINTRYFYLEIWYE